MSEREITSQPDVHISAIPDKPNRLVIAAVSLGAIAAIVGIEIGIRMALKATLIQCPDGTYFPQGTTDFRCFSHMHAGTGSAIALISFMLLILLVLVGVVANALLTRRSLR